MRKTQKLKKKDKEKDKGEIRLSCLVTRQIPLSHAIFATSSDSHLAIGLAVAVQETTQPRVFEPWKTCNFCPMKCEPRFT